MTSASPLLSGFDEGRGANQCRADQTFNQCTDEVFAKPAHVAAVADAAICPILTLEAQKWRQHARDLDEPLHIIEIADPEG
jgi:hypothetical protein